MRESPVNIDRKWFRWPGLIGKDDRRRGVAACYQVGTCPGIINCVMIELPMISDVHFEQAPERLKIALPLRRKWPFLILYSILVLLWVGMVVWGVTYLTQILLSGQSYRFLFGLILTVMLVILFRFGKFLMRQWAHYLSNREILFINHEELIVRRPVSIWGNTDVYDMAFVTPFYETKSPEALAFDYGYRHIYLGEALTADARQALRRHLNQTYFPDKIQDSA